MELFVWKLHPREAALVLGHLAADSYLNGTMAQGRHVPPYHHHILQKMMHNCHHCHGSVYA